MSSSDIHGEQMYETDYFLWSEQQAAFLRELARSGRDLPNALDLEHVAEEIEDIGRSELNSVWSFLRLILVQVVEAVSVPNADVILHRRREVVGFHIDLRSHVTPSMRGRIDLNAIWEAAIREADAALAVHGQVICADLPGPCPLDLPALLDPKFDLFEAVAAVREQMEAKRAG